MLNYRKRSHMFGVADLMMNRADIWGLRPDAMYITGLLHDIGNVHVITGHERVGAEMIRSFIDDPENLYAIEHHGDDLYMLEDEGIQIPNELLALVEADMSIDRYGWCAGFDARLNDLRSRYKNIETAEHNVEYLEKFYKDNGLSPPVQPGHEDE